MNQYSKSRIFYLLVFLGLILGIGLTNQFVSYRKFKASAKNLGAVPKTVVGREQYEDNFYGFRVVVPPGWYYTIPKGPESYQALPDDAFVMTNYHPATISFLEYLLRRPHRQPNAIKITITFDKENQKSLTGIMGELSKYYNVGITRVLKPSVEIISGNEFNYIPAVFVRQHDDRAEIIEFIAPNSQRFRILIQASDGLSKNRQAIDDALSSFALIGEDYKQDTSTWKRFDHVLGFSLEVPPTYIMPLGSQAALNEDNTPGEKWEFIPTDTKNYFPFSIWVSENTPFSSIEEWKEKSEFTKTHGFADEDIITVDGYSAFRYSAHPCETNTKCSSHIVSYGLVLLLDSKLVHLRSENLRVIATTVDDAENIFDFLRAEELFDRIISTFRLASDATSPLLPAESPDSSEDGHGVNEWLLP